MARGDGHVLLPLHGERDRVAAHWRAKVGLPQDTTGPLVEGPALAAFTSGDTALHTAASSGFNRVVQFLADHGAQLSVKNSRGQTPFGGADRESGPDGASEHRGPPAQAGGERLGARRPRVPTVTSAPAHVSERTRREASPDIGRL